jgi:hypothetical protein
MLGLTLVRLLLRDLSMLFTVSRVRLLSGPSFSTSEISWMRLPWSAASAAPRAAPAALGPCERGVLCPEPAMVLNNTLLKAA